ncbi:hypothetical protein KR026_010024 [Drosophila bipectinata]|nr:hypothetical protein KR026_010024 [Drosophila bipectinata]
MTDVNCLTSEHVATTSPPGTPTKNAVQSLLIEPTSPFVLRAPPSEKSKLILQNMEEVLNSVKQKHREKHKRKREEKRRAAAALLVEGDNPKKSDQDQEKPQPLREKSSQENGLKNGHRHRRSSPLKCSTPVADHQSIKKHFTKTGKPDANASAGAGVETKAKAPTNVFEFMMNARNRSIGVNEDGADAPADQEEGAGVVTAQTKRKQMLQEWNDRKGGTKRRLADEARGEFIEVQMEQRAKRLKKMLTKTDPKEVVAPSSAPAVTQNVKRPRGRPRGRRLSTMDPEAIVVTPKSQDPETEEFLSKLSSPTKKRDSLLGYFNKVESPKELAEKQPVAIDTPPMETPKRRTGRRKSNQETPVVMPADSTPSGRPRRSCAGKARYDYDLETSPSKATKGKVVQKAEESVEIIDLDNSNPACTPVKLAPLFVKQLPKPSPDPSVLKARQAFLQSGVPDKIRQEQNRQKQFEQMYEESYEVFPRLAHTGCESYVSKSEPLELPFVLRDEGFLEDMAGNPGKRRSKSSSFTSCIFANFSASLGSRKTNYSTLPQLDNKRGFVKLWKTAFDRFPTFKCYNQMREKYRHFSAIDSAQDTQQMGESFVVTRRTRRSMEQHADTGDEDVKPPPSAPNGELLFTEKYKPLLFEQVLVNLTPVQELKEFLAGWSGNGGSNRNSQTMDDSSFDLSLDSSSMGASSNTMVLVGPSSSGKTNAVFALANDMNFNVLEINAGMKRTGKKLIQELQEATQSHQIRKDSKSGGSSQQLLQKLQKGSLKAKAAAMETPSEVRKSLILIEDADILFDNMDAGFTEAIYTLAASSKRPVIVVATDPNCAHLQRLMQQNQIHFQAPNVLNISRFLAVLALMENCPIELDELISLYLYNKQNLRKTLLELQFYIQSGGDGSRVGGSKSPSKNSLTRLATVDGCNIHQRLFEFFTTSQNVQHRIVPFPVDFGLLRLNLPEFIATSPLLKDSGEAAAARPPAKRKSRSPKKAWLSSATGQKKEGSASPLATLASFYDNISLAAMVDSGSDCSDRLQVHLAEDIAHSLVEQALQTGLAAKECPYNFFDKPKQRKTISEYLGNGLIRSSSAKALDFEPCLRSICRSEKERAGQERRSSRFYHYLRNHTVNVTSFSLESFDAVCSVFQEEEEVSEGDPPAESAEKS